MKDKKQKKQYVWITPTKETGKKFTQFQIDLSYKLRENKMTDDRSLIVLLNTYKDFQRLNSELKRSHIKIISLERELKKRELEIMELRKGK